MVALMQLLDLEKPTTKSVSYAEWEFPPKVNLEIDEAAQFFN